MILVDIPEVRVDEDVAIRQKKRLRNFSLQQAQAAPGAQRRVLVHIIHGVILLQIVEIALDHALFVVYDHRKRAAAHIRKAVDDMLHNGHFPNGDQGLGQYFGVGIQTRAQTARHDDHGRACFFMCVDVQPAREHHVLHPAPLVQQRQRADAVFQQRGLGPRPRLHGQRVWAVIRRLPHRPFQRQALQDVAADIAVRNNGAQHALRRDEQHAQARFVQLAHCIQHRNVLGDEKVVHAHLFSPFRHAFTAPAARPPRAEQPPASGSWSTAG